MPDLLEQYSLETSRAPTPNVSPSEVAQPYTELARTLEKGGEATTEFAKTTAERAGFQAVTTDAQGNIQIQKAPIIGEASQTYERAVKIAALTRGEGAAKDADIKLRQQFQNDPDGYLNAANQYKDGVMQQYADLGVPEVGEILGKAIDGTTTYNYRQLETEHRELQFRAAAKDNADGIKDAYDTLVAGARAGALKDPNPDNWPEPFKVANNKWHFLNNERLTHPEYAYSQQQYERDEEQLASELKENGIAHHFVDEMYKNDPNPSTAGARTLESARSILTDPTVNLKTAERQKIYNFVAGEIHSEEALRKQDAGEARQSLESSLAYLKLGGNPRDIADETGNAIDVLKRTGYPGEAATFLSRVKIIEKGGGDFSRQPLDEQDQALSSPLATGIGGVRPSTPAEAALIHYESRSNPSLVNQFGYAGLYQFGAPLLSDRGLYKPGANENLATWSTTPRNEPGKWSGTFTIPGHPEVKTLSDFLQNPEAQKAAFDIHTAAMDQQIKTAGLDKYEGQTIGGVPITHSGLQAMIHLAGVGGTRATLESGGRIQPADAFGTTPLRYASLAAQADMPSPAGSLFLQVANASADQRDLRAELKTINSDFEKTHIPPSDKVINDLSTRADAAGDFALNAQLGAEVARWHLAAQQPGLSLPQQQEQIARIEAAGARGEFGAGYGEVVKTLSETTNAIREGLKKDPISTAVTGARGRLEQPQPLDLSDDAKLAAGLQQRVPIARWANQTWRGEPVAALDEADVDAVKAQLANPDPAVAARVWQAIAKLPEDVRGPTLKKIAGGDPAQTIEAGAGALMAQPGARDIANSIITGARMIRGGKFDVDKAFGTKNPQGETFVDDFNKALPATVFPMGAARTDPTGDYATFGGMAKARYAYLSAQSGDMDYSKDRVNQAVADVTGGVLSLHGGQFIAPARGMPQAQFDNVFGSLNDDDFKGVTFLDGTPITAAYVKANARLESVGPGRYRVALGRDQAAPNYAYLGADTDQPIKFELNLRNRQPVPLQYQAIPENVFMPNVTPPPAPRSRPQPTLSGDQPSVSDLAFSSALGIRG